MNPPDRTDREDTRRLLADLSLPPSGSVSAAAHPSRWLGWAVPTLGLLVTVAWWLGARSEAAPAPDPAGEVAVEAAGGNAQAVTAPVQTRGVLQASGFVVARQQATVSADTTGRLTAVHVAEGDKVRAGDVLAEIDPSIAGVQADVARADVDAAHGRAAVTRARVADARQKLARFRELAAGQYVSQADVDAAENQVSILEAQLASELDAAEASAQRLRLEKQRIESTRIVAPFDGVVTGLSAHVGEIVSPISAGGGFTRTGICTIVDLDSIEAEASISEQHLARVREGQQVSIRAAAHPDTGFSGRVIGITPVVERNAAAINVRVGIDASEQRLMPGMRIELDFLRPDDPVAVNNGGTGHEG